MLYTQVPLNTFETLQMNAGIMVKSFNPATGVAGTILGATTGGFNVKANPTYEDFFADIDNMPPNTMQGKRVKSYDPTASGTFRTISAALARKLNGASSVGSGGDSHIVPTHTLTASDFEDFWIIGDYSGQNEGAGTAGYCAIHMMNALNTAGFQWQSGPDAKGQFPFEYHGHYDLNNINKAPFEIYIKAGASDAAPFIRLNAKTITLPVDGTQLLVADVIPAGSTVTWQTSSSTYATVSDGLVTAKTAGSAIITASITIDGVAYTDTCTVVVESAST